MGYTDIDEGTYSPPGWMSLYKKLKHCKFCNTVYNIDIEYAKVRSISSGTSTPTFSYVRKCKENVCPCCEK